MTLRYLAIADHVAELIEHGSLAPGQKVPSVRTLSAKLGTSPATVFAAYGELEQRGLVRARPQSGFYVQPILHQLAPVPVQQPVRTAATAISAEGMLEGLIADGQRPGVIALDAATPRAELLPEAALGRALSRAGRKARAVEYCYPPGQLALRRAIVVRLLDAGVRAAPDDVVVTTGATDALQLCLRAVTRPGDTVAVESPTYYGALQTLEALGLKVVEVATDPQLGLDVRDLRRVLARRRIAACFAMPSFSNPTGSEMPEAAKAELVELLERARVPLVEDDVNGELFFGTRRPRAAKSYDRSGNVLLCSSVSKTLAPGYRVGWALPGKWRAQVIALQWATTISSNTPSQLAIAELLRAGELERHLRRLRATIQQTMQRASTAIARYFPTGTSVTRPRGGLVLWVGLPARMDSRVVQRRALADGISIMPGELFAARPTYRRYLRLNCGMRYSPAIDDAIARLGRIAAG